MFSWPYTRAFKFSWLLPIATAFLLPFITCPAAADPTLRIMTRNLYMGSGFAEVGAAQTPAEFVAAVAKVYQRMLANKPEERMAAIAQEIARFSPDIVGLQEAAILRTGAVTPATEVKFDLLQLLVAELAKLGQDYAIVGIMPGPDVEVPSALGFRVRITVRDAMIARVNGDVKLSNLQVQRFLAEVTATSPVAGTIANPSGWISVDAKTHGRSVRVVTTHLPVVADLNPTIPVANARELVATAGNTTLPVVFIGDFNTPANLPSNPLHAIYASMINAGFTDAWTLVNPTDPGLTCCQAPDLSNPLSILSVRVDLALLRGAIGVAEARLVGNSPSDRTAPSFLWPSDHAGLAVTLTLPQ